MPVRILFQSSRNSTHKKVKSKSKSTNVRKRSLIFNKYILIVIFFTFFLGSHHNVEFNFYQFSLTLVLIKN